MSLIGIIASQNYPRTFSCNYLVIAGGGAGGWHAGGGGGASELPLEAGRCFAFPQGRRGLSLADPVTGALCPCPRPIPKLPPN